MLVVGALGAPFCALVVQECSWCCQLHLQGP